MFSVLGYLLIEKIEKLLKSAFAELGYSNCHREEHVSMGTQIIGES